jgi:hypothetical protein
MSKYWIANNPGSTITSGEAESIAIIARNASTDGNVNVSQITWSSVVSDPTGLLSVTIAPTSRVLVTTATATANGVVAGGGSTDTVGQIKIQVQTSTGGTVNRYILLYSS